MRKLTIGFTTYDDFNGVYFTIQALRMYHSEVINDIEFIIIDNNPGSGHGKALKDFTKHIKEPFQYIPFTEYSSTAIRTKIFEYANTPYVLVMDCHVFLVPGSIKKLIDYYDSKKDDGNLLSGPMLYDNLHTTATHWDLLWRSQMWGIWGNDIRGNNPDGEAFEIPAMGLGIFSCRKNCWLGFNSNFRGFGGEEGYIHEKYRKAGKKAMCLPFLRWMHRFGRPEGVQYPLTLENKIRNYFIGHLELELDVTPIKMHFKDIVSEDAINKLYEEAKLTLLK